MYYQALTVAPLEACPNRPTKAFMPRPSPPSAFEPLPRPPKPSMKILGPGRTRPPSTTLRTLSLATSGISLLRSTVKRIQAISGNSAIIPALLDHEATRGLPVCMDIPTFPTFPCSSAPLCLSNGFLTPGKPLPPTRWHLPAIPSDFLDRLVLSAPECLPMSRNDRVVPWHSFSRSGRCHLLAHTSIGNLCIARAPCAGRLILVAEALSRAKCGLRYHVPGTPRTRPISHPITHLSVTNKE